MKLKVHIPCFGFLSILQHHKNISQLCICNKCQVEYGSCELFCQYILEVVQLKKMNLRSAQTEEFLKEGVVNEFLMAYSIFAVAADSKSSDTFWFVRLYSNPEEAIAYITDDYGHNQDKHTYVPHSMRSKNNQKFTGLLANEQFSISVQ